ncbi:hypothetical protein SLOPH_967 [Spraguea lophii 42_110]|uniref:Uncharacterized protein n=1 Tax=Spraguea lophii (strain 42_110) TaxID=1358809 RepID=S7WE26_SPRLO|nr:hypothetical protein SLOPH_967 [Spraguea lophii 42_110]
MSFIGAHKKLSIGVAVCFVCALGGCVVYYSFFKAGNENVTSETKTSTCFSDAYLSMEKIKNESKSISEKCVGDCDKEVLEVKGEILKGPDENSSKTEVKNDEMEKSGKEDKKLDQETVDENGQIQEKYEGGVLNATISSKVEFNLKSVIKFLTMLLQEKKNKSEKEDLNKDKCLSVESGVCEYVDDNIPKDKKPEVETQEDIKAKVNLAKNIKENIVESIGNETSIINDMENPEEFEKFVTPFVSAMMKKEIRKLTHMYDLTDRNIVEIKKSERFNEDKITPPVKPKKIFKRKEMIQGFKPCSKNFSKNQPDNSNELKNNAQTSFVEKRDVVETNESVTVAETSLNTQSDDSKELKNNAQTSFAGIEDCVKPNESDPVVEAYFSVRSDNSDEIKNNVQASFIEKKDVVETNDAPIENEQNDSSKIKIPLNPDFIPIDIINCEEKDIIEYSKKLLKQYNVINTRLETILCRLEACDEELANSSSEDSLDLAELFGHPFDPAKEKKEIHNPQNHPSQVTSNDIEMSVQSDFFPEGPGSTSSPIIYTGETVDEVKTVKDIEKSTLNTTESFYDTRKMLGIFDKEYLTLDESEKAIYKRFIALIRIIAKSEINIYHRSSSCENKKVIGDHNTEGVQPFNTDDYCDTEKCTLCLDPKIKECENTVEINKYESTGSKPLSNQYIPQYGTTDYLCDKTPDDELPTGFKILSDDVLASLSEPVEAFIPLEKKNHDSQKKEMTFSEYQNKFKRLSNRKPRDVLLSLSQPAPDSVPVEKKDKDSRKKKVTFSQYEYSNNPSFEMKDPEFTYKDSQQIELDKITDNILGKYIPYSSTRKLKHHNN